jgi:putative endonuclease
LTWYVYIISNANHTLYVGMTADLIRRVIQHSNGTFRNSFTRRYNFERLVFFEELPSRIAAARREKQLKGWKRDRKLALIEQSNRTGKTLVLRGTMRFACDDGPDPSAAPSLRFGAASG